MGCLLNGLLSDVACYAHCLKGCGYLGGDCVKQALIGGEAYSIEKFKGLWRMALRIGLITDYFKNNHKYSIGNTTDTSL